MKTRPHQRDKESNQQTSTAVRPPLPRDGSSGHKQWTPGNLPMGGFTSVWDFSENRSNKLSPTSIPGNTKKGKL